MTDLEIVVASVHAHRLLADVQGLTLGVGRAAITEPAAPPRIVWIETRDQFEPWDPGYTVESQVPGQRQPVRSCYSGFEAHLWTDGKATLQVLRNRVIVALHESLGALLKGLSGWRPTETDRQEIGWSTNGDLYVLEGQYVAHVYEEPWPTARIKYSVEIGEIDTDGGIE